MTQLNILKKYKLLENNSNDNTQFEFDFAMCHGSYCC